MLGLRKSTKPKQTSMKYCRPISITVVNTLYRQGLQVMQRTYYSRSTVAAE
jgi:hypothetical protein